MNPQMCSSVGCIPRRAKKVEGLGKDIVVNDSSVHREHAHHENDVATMIQGHEHLQDTRK